jgi:hypothetical protein
VNLVAEDEMDPDDADNVTGDTEGAIPDGASAEWIKQQPLPYDSVRTKLPSC